MMDLSFRCGFHRLGILGALLVMIGTSGCGTTRSPGQVAAMLSVSSPTLSFGNVAVGSSTAQLVSITNTGAENVRILGVSITGGGFSTSGTANVTLTPNQSMTISVNFIPATPGALAGALVVSSNAENPSLQVGLSGTGTTASGHSVTLSWTPSTSEVIGYLVFRGTVSGGPYVQVNSSIDPNPSYTDIGLSSGSYFYVVTSVSTNDVESGFSDEVNVVVP